MVLSENCALLGHYAASGGNFLPTFWDTRSLKIVPIDRPETSVRNYQYWLRNDPEEGSSLILPGGSLESHVVLSDSRHCSTKFCIVLGKPIDFIHVLSVTDRHIKSTF